MKTLIYAKRNLKELLSDPVSLIFTIGLPVFLLIFMVSLNENLGVNDVYKVENFVPSTIIFSYAFLTMFSGMLVAKDRSSAFLSRMFISPLKPHHYILGYMIPLLLIALIQSIILYAVGFIMGLPITIHVLTSLPFLLLISLLFIGLGILFGSLLKDQQVGPITSILIQVVAFLSGMWFSLDLVGGFFKQVGYVLPFAHGVDMVRSVIAGDYTTILIPLVVVCTYSIASIICSIIMFKKQMSS